MQEYKERNGCHTHYRKNNQCIQHIINCSYYNINLFLPIRLKIQVLLNISTTCIPKIHQKMPSEQNLSRYTLKYPSGNPRTSPSSSSFANYTGTNVNKVLFSGGLRQVPRRGGRKGVAPLNKGLSRSDWGLRWEGPTGPHRSVSEVSGRGTEAAQVPAQRSGAAYPTGAVTAGDWGWTDRISEIINVSVTDSGHK